MRYLRYCAIVNSTVLIALSLYFLIGPFAILAHDLRDPGLSNGSMPEFAYRWHKQLSKHYEPWALERVKDGKAAQLELTDISGTEWPMFSSVFYLWATESL